MPIVRFAAPALGLCAALSAAPAWARHPPHPHGGPPGRALVPPPPGVVVVPPGPRGHRHGVAVVAPPPAPTALPPGQYRRMRANVAPPPVVMEARPAAPSPRHVWVPGYWTWRSGRHIWMRGSYVVPPAVGRVWVEPRWVAEGPEWVFYPGRWDTAAVPAPTLSGAVVPPPPPVVPGEVYVESAPPPLQPETPAPMPGPGHIWDAGHWEWRGGKWAWIGGHWEATRPGLRWEPAHWEQHGHRWRFKPGHWHR